ncbi:MAG: hypothetical protein K2X04_11120 [Burkholderiales bacterium]|nr:hypothetical protein [Burkholderiales bacterium]
MNYISHGFCRKNILLALCCFILTACVSGGNNLSIVNNFWFDSAPGMPIITNLSINNAGLYSTGASGYYGVYTPSSSSSDGYWNVSVHADQIPCWPQDNNCIGSPGAPAGVNGPYANSTIQSWTTGWFIMYGDWTFQFNLTPSLNNLGENFCITNFAIGMVNSQWFVQPSGAQGIIFSQDTLITQTSNNGLTGLGLSCLNTPQANLAVYNNGNNANEMYATPIPGGDYVQSCRNIFPSMKGNTLTLNADCYNSDTNQFNPSQVSLDMSLITNTSQYYSCSYNSGGLSCNIQNYTPGGLPGGSWTQSCKDSNMTWTEGGYVLYAACTPKDGPPYSSETSYSFGSYYNTSYWTCANNGGQLACSL